jgi:hypothetical protein
MERKDRLNGSKTINEMGWPHTGITDGFSSACGVLPAYMYCKHFHSPNRKYYHIGGKENLGAL